MQLTSNHLALLLDEVSAMVSADRPMAAGLLELGDRSLGRLGRTAKRLSARLESGESPATAFASVSGTSSTGVAAAFRMLDRLVQRLLFVAWLVRFKVAMKREHSS